MSPDNGDNTFGDTNSNIDDRLTVISSFRPCPS